MDLHLAILQNHMDIYVESLHASARYHRSGRPSVVVSLIGGAAGVFERMASRIERWAKGTTETQAEALQILGGVR